MKAVLKTGAPIILLFPDQLRADALGVSGNSFVQTPHIDRLASESVCFETCITNAPLCRPARITMMTGLPVSAHRFDSNLRVPDPVSMPSHVRELRDQAGYHTAVVGKTHLHNGGGHLDDHSEVLRQWGFCDALELPDAQRHDVRSAHTDWLTSTTPKGSMDKLARWRDYVAQHSLDSAPPDTPPWNLSTEDHLDSFCARAAAERVRGYQGDSPLYLQVNFPGPHPPFDPTIEFLEPLDEQDPELPLPILDASTGPLSPVARRYRRKQREWTESEARRLRIAYFGKVALVDQGVGRVMEALGDAGLMDEAWIMLASDHGELLGDHHMTGKVLCYEAALRVPLLVRPPGGTHSRVDPGPVNLLDVVATISAIAGLSPTGGQSLTERVLAGPSPVDESRSVVFENMGTVGIRSPTATMTWDRSSAQPVELFDREGDPLQLHNVVDVPAYRETLQELLSLLGDRR